MRPIMRELLVHLEPGPWKIESRKWGPNTRVAVRDAVALRWVDRGPDALTLTPRGQRALDGERRWDELRQQRPSEEDITYFRARAWARLRAFVRAEAAKNRRGSRAA